MRRHLPKLAAATAGALAYIVGGWRSTVVLVVLFLAALAALAAVSLIREHRRRRQQLAAARARWTSSYTAAMDRPGPPWEPVNPADFPHSTPVGLVVTHDSAPRRP